MNSIKGINKVYSVKNVASTDNDKAAANNNTKNDNTTKNNTNNKDKLPDYYAEAAAEYNTIKENYEKYDQYNYLVINSSNTTSLKNEEYNYLGDWDPERIQANRDQLA